AAFVAAFSVAAIVVGTFAVAAIVAAFPVAVTVVRAFAAAFVAAFSVAAASAARVGGGNNEDDALPPCLIARRIRHGVGQLVCAGPARVHIPRNGDERRQIPVVVVMG